MFGLIVTGRPLQNFEAVTSEPNQGRYISTIPDTESIKHIVVFLSQPLPEGLGAGVYFSWPGANNEVAQQWLFLGFLSNQKPSAIYKIVRPKEKDGDRDVSHQAAATVMFSAPSTPNIAAVGVSLETLAQLTSLQPVLGEPLQRSNMEEFGEKMLESFVNYVVSFSVKDPANPQDIYVPMKTINAWLENFKRRLSRDPGFWK